MPQYVVAGMSYVGAPLSSERQDWGTPPDFIEWLTGRFDELTDGFDLVAAASSHNHKAPNFFTIDDNALFQSWFGNVWLNPPFGDGLKNWLSKCALEIENPEVKSIYVLIPARTDTKWFHEIVIEHAAFVYLIKGRFNFIHGDAVDAANAPFPSMLVVYRHRLLPPLGAVIAPLIVPKNARGF